MTAGVWLGLKYEVILLPAAAEHKVRWIITRGWFRMVGQLLHMGLCGLRGHCVSLGDAH